MRERFWTNLQAEYDLSLVRMKKKAALDRIVPYAREAPVADVARA